MKEINLIINAYHQAKQTNEKMALATVVKVDGSAYRRPGARMLITENGTLTGAISGGCLEGDALRKAQGVIFQHKAMLVTYDTTDEDDQKFGVGLGCNGIIHVLIEPIDLSDRFNPIELLIQATSERRTAKIFTFFSLKHSKKEQIGTKLVSIGPSPIISPLVDNSSLLKSFIDKGYYRFENQSSTFYFLPENEEISVFEDVIKPTLKLFLFGAGNDTRPVAALADLLGWEVVLIDGRKHLANQERFPQVKEFILGSAEEVLDKLVLDSFSVALLMTHNFEYEAVVLAHLATLEIPYIGILGPKKKTQKLLDRLSAKGISPILDNIYGPMGLNIGAEGSEEIALSILSEIKSVLNKKQPYSLREKSGPIHDSNA